MTETDQTKSKYNFYTLRMKGTHEIMYVGSTRTPLKTRWGCHIRALNNPRTKMFICKVYIKCPNSF